ncbi:hypothetical protein Tco_0613612 [Tanacetum coccineum]
MEMKRTANELLFADVEYMRKRYWIIEFQGYIDQFDMLMECSGRSKGINKYTSTLQSQGAKDGVAMTVESARTSTTEMSSPLYAA